MKRVTILIRMMTMVPVVLSVFWTVFNQAGLFTAVLSSWIAIVIGEWKVWTELRLRIVGVMAVLLTVVLFMMQHLLIEWSVVPMILGSVGALWLNTLLWAGVGFGGFVLVFAYWRNVSPRGSLSNWL